MFQRQVDPRQWSEEIVPSVDFRTWRAQLERVKQESGSASAVALQRIGAFALATPTVSATRRKQVIASRLPTDTSPDTRLLIVAVHVAAGERAVFDRASGVSLVDAVTASCALPGIWPAVDLGAHQYMDGGVYSIENADLAAACERVLIVSLPPVVPPISITPVEGARQTLRAAGARIGIVQPDEACRAAFASVGNLLDPSVSEPAARAGREQGRHIALTELASVWT
jgi:NTE family protein